MTIGLNIAISGCGITGTAAAWFLAQSGHQVTVFEQAAVCRPLGAGILLQPGGQQVLQRMGLLDTLIAQSSRLNGMTAMLTSGRRLVRLQYADLQPGLFGLGVHRGRLFDLLLSACRANGVKIVNAARVTGCSQIGQRMSLQWQWQRQSADSQGACPAEEFDFLIAADGSRSLLRESCQIPTRVIDYDFAALWTTGPADWQSDELYQRVQGTHYLIGMLPIGQGECSYFWGLPVASWDALRGSSFSDWRSLSQGLCPASASVLAGKSSFDELTFATYRHVVMRRWHSDRVVFLGDAAHATSPHLGQGVNLGLEDAECFATALQQQGSQFLPACHQFVTQRRRKLRYYQRLTRLISPFFQSRGVVKGWGRDLCLPWFPYLPLVERQMLRTLCGSKQGWLG